MTSTASQQLETCQACFALNNLGVTLLKNGHFRDACKTFKAAVSALRPLLTGQQGSSNVTLQAEVIKASARATKNATHLPPSIEISPLEQGDEDAWRAAQQYGPTASMVFPICFRDLPDSSSLQAAALNFSVSVLVYNYGVARLLVHRFARHSKHDTFLDEAQILLTFAESAISRNLQFVAVETTRHGGHSLLECCCLASLILGHLSLVYRLQRQHDKVLWIHASLVELQKVQNELWTESSVTVTPQRELAAAAA